MSRAAPKYKSLLGHSRTSQPSLQGRAAVFKAAEGLAAGWQVLLWPFQPTLMSNSVHEWAQPPWSAGALGVNPQPGWLSDAVNTSHEIPIQIPLFHRAPPLPPPYLDCPAKPAHFSFSSRDDVTHATPFFPVPSHSSGLGTNCCGAESSRPVAACTRGSSPPARYLQRVCHCAELPAVVAQMRLCPPNQSGL